MNLPAELIAPCRTIPRLPVRICGCRWAASGYADAFVKAINETGDGSWQRSVGLDGRLGATLQMTVHGVGPGRLKTLARGSTGKWHGGLHLKADRGNLSGVF